MLTAEQLNDLPAVFDMPNEDYHASAGISNSGVSLLLDCPLKYWDTYLNPDRPAKEETAAMRFGTMLHTFLLEPDEFNERYVVTDKMHKASKAYKDFVALNEGRTVINEEEMDILYKIQESISNHRYAQHLIKPHGEVEQSIFWRDELTDVICKSRPDYMTKEYIVDLKSTKCASPESFERSIYELGYHRQAAMMLDAFEAISGIKHTNFLNLCIEKERPYIVSVFVMSDEALERGREEYRTALRIFKQCSERNYWPMYADDIEEISLPAWVINRENKGEKYVNS